MISMPFDEEKSKECAQWVRDCAEILGGPNLSERGVAVYLNAVHCTDADKVIQALKHCLYNDERFPVPIVIYRRIRHIAAEKKRHEEEVAWKEARAREIEDKKRFEAFVAQEKARSAAGQEQH